MTERNKVRELRWVEGFGLRPHGAGLDVVGGRRTARLRVPGGPDEVLRVVDLVRAGQSLDVVARRLALSVDEAHERLRPLLRLGALVDATVPVPAGPPQMVRFFERTLGAAAAALALDRLARATVHLDCPAEVYAILARQLLDSGVGTVTGPVACAAGSGDGGEDDSALVLTSHPPTGALRERQVGWHLPTLFLTLGVDEALVGPLCNVPGGRCSQCLDVPAAPAAGSTTDPTISAQAVAVCVNEMVRCLSRTGHCRTSGGVLRIGSVGQHRAFEPISRDVSCTWCGVPAETLSTGAHRAYPLLQAADVPLRANWTHPVGPVDVPPTDCTITVFPLPDRGPAQVERPGWSAALAAIMDVLAPHARSHRRQVPSVGGARLLNIFLIGMPDDQPILYYLDARRRKMRPLPEAGLVHQVGASSRHLTVIVTAALNRAENLFGPRASLVVHQDTGFLLETMEVALAGHGFTAAQRAHGSAGSAQVLRALALDPIRDLLTAVVDVPITPGRAGTPAPAPSFSSVRRDWIHRADLEEILPGRPDDVAAFVRCYTVAGAAPGVHLAATSGLEPVPPSPAGLDDALARRAMAPAALVFFTSPLGSMLSSGDHTGLGAAVVKQARLAQQVRRRAREWGLDALVMTDLPSTALAPDGRGWRTTYRSFAAVAVDQRGALEGSDQVAVLW